MITIISSPYAPLCKKIVGFVGLYISLLLLKRCRWEHVNIDLVSVTNQIKRIFYCKNLVHNVCSDQTAQTV